MTMANSMGIPPFLTGGAILAGIFFGDRCSPVSTSALLVSELTKTDLFSNIRNMTRSALVPFILSCVLYGILGFSVHTSTAVDTTRNLLVNYYNFTPLMLLPVMIVLVLGCKKDHCHQRTGGNGHCGECTALSGVGTSCFMFLRIFAF